MGNRLENDKPVDTEQLEGTCKGDLADFRQKLVDRPGVDSKPPWVHGSVTMPLMQ